MYNNAVMEMRPILCFTRVHMYDIVTLGRKDNALEPGNHIATLMSSAFDLLTPYFLSHE